MAAPATKSRLPRIDPVSDALTTLFSPLLMAMTAMMSSAAFPNVALSSPPHVGPVRSASCSVASPMSRAIGMMETAASKKVTVGSHDLWCPSAPTPSHR